MALSYFPFFFCSLLILLLPSVSLAEALPSPYVSPSTFLRDFPRMLRDLRIFAYGAPAGNSSGFRSSSPAALFHASLFRSAFLTPDPEEAHLFYLSFPGAPGPRSIARSVRAIRSDLPFWNRTLGADHFHFSEDGIGDSSDRNLVELRKNSVQISPFPAVPGRFIPHKDLTLPSPVSDSPLRFMEESSFQFLAFYDGVAVDPQVSAVLEELRRDPKILIQPRRMDPTERAQVMSASRFCLFFYGAELDPPLGEALASGCVPVVVSGRPILDLPFGDVLRWSEMALFVGLHGGAGEVRRAMERACGERYPRMRVAAAEASAHFRWRSAAHQPPLDAFHTVLYQLWLRRHTVRYARWGASKFVRSDG
uniref:Putative glycosyltransferase At3g07620 n=1 Tax=Anthurium amnicola TaxID=1678845 RepID=A0A1D1XQD9_9ARAE